MRIISRIVVATLMGTLASDGGFAQEISHRIFEAYPDFIQARIENRDRSVRSLPQIDDAVSPYSLVMEEALKWVPGKTITVAFEGGYTELHRKIEQVASEWTNYANLNLDFGFDPVTGSYRAWASSDTSYSADIRISFRSGDQYGGYWSFVGTESINPDLTEPNQPSLNLQGFDKRLPWDWTAVVLHEFGHAIGAHHEHQHPVDGCDDEWRWDDDPGYEKTKIL